MNTIPTTPEELDSLFEEEFKADAAEAAKDDDEKKKPKYEKRELAELRSNLFEKGSSFKPTRKEEIIGIDNVLVEIDKVIFWLQNSTRFQSHKARLEPGVIFEGDPGTGKTLVSRYIATESNSLFVNVRDFAHNGPLFKDSDIRDLFRRARATYSLTGCPIVLFWDEFENGAAERANASAEQAATVSQLTAELDGVHGKNEGVLLIGCTNYIYGIDKALRRSGRMGLQIEFCAPDRKGKKLLLDYYVKGYPSKGKIDVETLSYFLSERDTAASIEEACMEAWRVAVERVIRSGSKTKPKLVQQDLIDVLLQRLVGPPTAFIDLPKEDRERVAVHEVGHAMMSLVFNIPLRLITVQPGKKALGKVITYQVKEHIGTVDEIISDMRVTVGSICAERVAGVPQGIGGTSDVDMVNQMAVQLVDDLHGGEHTGLYRPFSVGNERRSGGEGAFPNVSDRSVEQSDLDVQSYLKRVESDGDKTMAKIGADHIWEIAKEVNERVTLTGIEFEALFRKVTGKDPSHYRPEISAA